MVRTLLLSGAPEREDPMSQPTFALPTQPLLETTPPALARFRAGRDVEEFLAELAAEPDILARGAKFYTVVRKRLDKPELLTIFQGALAAAVRGEPDGVAALAAMLAVHAPGEMVIERVREFANLHRVSERLYHALDAGESIGQDGKSFLQRLEELDEDLAPVYDETWGDAAGLPHPRDIGPARVSRRAFAALIAELEATGTLDADALDAFVRLAELELTSIQMRSESLAGSINPFSARHVGTVMPILSGLDTEVRDMRAFLGMLREKRKASLFHQQRPAVHDQLEAHEHRALVARIKEDPMLLPLRRLYAALERRPLSNRVLGYYVDRILELGTILHRQGARRQPLDVVGALLLAIDFLGDGRVVFPAGDQVLAALRDEIPTGVEVRGGQLTLPFDPTAARILPMPMGLPVPVPETAEEREEEASVEENIKDLVMGNLNNTSVLLGLLKNSKVIGTPGIVALVVTRCRNMRVIETVCEQRQLHTGYANKDVPLALLRSPMRVPVKTLRRFINVRFVNKIELRRLAVDRSAVRREVADEIVRYLKTLA